MNQQQDGSKPGTWGSIRDSLVASFFYGGLTYVTWGRLYWIPTIRFGFFLLMQLISIPMDFFPSISQVEPISPFATQEELKEWNKRGNHRMLRRQQHQQQ